MLAGAVSCAAGTCSSRGCNYVIVGNLPYSNIYYNLARIELTTPKTKGRLGIVAMGVGGYLILNAILLAALALPLQPPEQIPGQAFGVALVTAIADTLLYYGNKHREKAKTEARQTS